MTLGLNRLPVLHLRKTLARATQFRATHQLRQWVKGSAIGLTVAALSGTLALAPSPVRALETIELKPSFLLDGPLTMEALEAFVNEGEKTEDLQLLLDLISGFADLEETDIRKFFAQVSEVNGPLVDRFLSSYIGEVIAQELSLVLDPTNGDSPEVWQAYRDAFAQAASDGEVSILEVLQAYEPDNIQVDVQRFSKLQKRLETDVKDLQAIAGVEVSAADLSAGLDQLFCTESALGDDQVMDLINSFSTAVDMPVTEALSQSVEIDPALLDRFLTSFFGETVVRQAAFALAPGSSKVQLDEGKLEENIASAISAAAADGNFSIMEALENYQPNAVDSNVTLMSSIVMRMQTDIKDFQGLLNLDELTDLTVIIQELICAPDTPGT